MRSRNCKTVSTAERFVLSILRSAASDSEMGFI
jgi:hypothetical protein